MDSGGGFAGGADIDLGYHGDMAARGARVDFAVNVRGETPSWLVEGLAGHLGDLAAYPDPGLDARVRELIGARHGRPAEEVLLLAGVAEGFALLPELTGHPAIVHPQFTEPEAALRAAGLDVERVVLAEPWRLSQVGAGAAPGSDMLIVGNPTNPTSVLHPREEVLALAAPGRLLVVDEAFMDVVADGEREAAEVAGERRDDLLVFRSLTKTWALAGLRCGYALGSPEVLARLARRRPAWPVGTLQLRAMELVAERGMGDGAGDPLPGERAGIAAERDVMTRALADAGWSVHPAAGPFVLARPPVAGGDGGDAHGAGEAPAADAAARAAQAADAAARAAGATEHVRHALADRGIAVRRCDTFPGLDARWWRLAVRRGADVGTLVEEVARITGVGEPPAGDPGPAPAARPGSARQAPAADAAATDGQN